MKLLQIGIQMGLLLCPFLLSAAETILDWNFKTNPDDLKQVEQCTQTYYQPLGNVSAGAGGLAMTAGPEKPVVMQTIRKYPVKQGDRIQIEILADCVQGTKFQLSLLGHDKRGWLKNDAVTVAATKSGLQKIRRVITVTESKDQKQVDSARIAFGLLKGESATVESINAKLKPAPQEPVVFREKAKRGLIAHFDVSTPNSFQLENGKLISLRNLADESNPAAPRTPGKAPDVAVKSWDGKSVLRFNGTQELLTKETIGSKEITVFAVFRRLPEQKGMNWQNLLYWDEGNRHGAGSYTLTSGNDGGAPVEPTLLAATANGEFKYPLLIGSNGGIGGFFSGDLAEILVYDTASLAPETIAEVREKLTKKWGIQDRDWLRIGSLPPPPERKTDRLPLSDQSNRGDWTLMPELSDEFNGNLDRSKWLDMRHYTLGIAPSRILPENLVFQDGAVHLMARYDPSLPSGRIRPHDQEYHSFTVARLFSKFTFRYGYIETRAKVFASSFNSAFWLYGVGKSKETGQRIAPEIDIFELAGKSFAHTYSYNTALHNVISPGGKHVKSAKIWISSFKFTDEYHVYGLEWRPDRMIFYVDGHIVRDVQIKDNQWDMPMRVHFDLMPHFEWFGVPDPADFPGSFSIDYVRIWKSPGTTLPDTDWQKKYQWDYPAPETGFAYDYLKKYGTKIVPVEEVFDKPERISILNKTALSADGVSGLNGAGTGIGMYFPASMTRDSGGEQYAAPSPTWPSMTLSTPVLTQTKWKGFRYLVFDYFNPGSLQSCNISVRTTDGKVQSGAILMKHGQGFYELKLSADISDREVESITFRIRGSDKPQGFTLRDLSLEKE